MKAVKILFWLIFVLYPTWGLALNHTNAPSSFIQGYIQFWNDSSVDAKSYVEKFYSKKYIERGGIEEFIKTLRRYANQDGELKLIHVETDSKLEKAFVVSSTKAGALSVLLQLNGNEKITRFSMLPGPILNLEQKGISETALIAQVNQYVDELVASGRFSGSVVIKKGETYLVDRHVGFANKHKKISNSSHTRHNVGSMSKLFTAIAIAQLVEQGAVEYEDVVGKHLPNYPNSQVREKVTIKHLLTHTSGLDGFWGAQYDQIKDSISSTQQHADIFMNTKLLFEPGTRFHYSNAGPIVLALILEKVTGISYYDYMQKHVFEAAGLKGNNYFLNDGSDDTKAIGYLNGKTANSDRVGRLGSAAGSAMLSTVEIEQLMSALLSNRLISKRSFEQLVSKQQRISVFDYYGYLTAIQESNGKLAFGHNGSTYGVSSDLLIFPNQNIQMIILSNYGRIALDVSQFVKSKLFSLEMALSQ